MPWEQRRVGFFQTFKAAVQAKDPDAAKAYDALLTDFDTHPMARTPMENMDYLGVYYVPREGAEKCFVVVVLNAALGWYDALRFGSESGRSDIVLKEKFFVRAFALAGPEKQKQAAAFIVGNPAGLGPVVEAGLQMAARQRDTDLYDHTWPTAYGSERKAGIAVAPLPREQWDNAWEQAKARVRSYYIVRKPAPERLQYTPEVRKQSLAGAVLFHDLLSAPGGVAMMDEVPYPKATQRKLIKVEVLSPYQNGQVGREKWTVDHADDSPASYTVRLSPTAGGGTDFAVSKDK